MFVIVTINQFLLLMVKKFRFVPKINRNEPIFRLDLLGLNLYNIGINKIKRVEAARNDYKKRKGLDGSPMLKKKTVTAMFR